MTAVLSVAYPRANNVSTVTYE